MQFFQSIKSINDSELYKHSREFPEISPDTIEKNFSFNDNEDKFNLDDQNIRNIIIETSEHNIDYIKKLITSYKENINNYNSKEKRIIIIVFINANIESNYEVDFAGNYDLLFHEDLFPPNPHKTDLFDFIQKMNCLLYNLFSHIKPNQQEEFLNTLQLIWAKNDTNWIYNLFPFINKIIENHNESVFSVFTNSKLFTDTFLAKSYEDSILFNFVSRIFISNSNVLLNKEIIKYLKDTIEHKEYRKPLINWISTGLDFFSKIKYNQNDRKSVINQIFSLFIGITTKDLNLDEVNYVLESISDPFISLEAPIFTDNELANQILINLSTFSKLSSDFYFKFLDFLSKLNDKFEVFDNSSFDPVFNNMKQNQFQKVDIEKLWEFTLKKDVNDIKNDDKILNWRGIELILSYVEIDEVCITEKLQSMIMINSNLYEFHKANLTTFLIKRIYEIQENKKIFQAYYFVLEMIVSFILTEKEMFELLKLIKKNDFKYPIEIIQIFLNIIQKQADQFNPKSFIRFDRENQFLSGPRRRISDSHSICFAFKLTQKVDDSIKYEIISVLYQEQKKFCSLYLHNKMLNIEKLDRDSTSSSVVDNFPIENEKWNFIEISINNKFNQIRLRINEMEKYIEHKVMIKRNSITEILTKKTTNPKGYHISIKTSVFDYSNIFVISNLIDSKRPSFYYLMKKHQMDLMKVQSALPNNLNYCLYPTFNDGKYSNTIKLIRNYNLENQNDIENNDVNFYGRTFSNVSNIFDILDSIDLRKFFLILFDKLSSSSSFTVPQGQSYLLKLLQIFESLNFKKTKTVELLSISLSSIDCKFVSLSEISKCFDLWNSLKSKKIKREFLQSIFFNFSFVSKLKPEIQIKLFKKCSKIHHLDVKSFESLLFNAINYYGTESELSEYAWTLLTNIFNPNNQNDLESLITTTMKNISIYITKKCVTILTDTITKIEINEFSKTKKMFALSVFLTSVNDIEIQELGVKLFCLIERYFNIAENKSNIIQTPINSIKYIYQMILSSNVDHDTSQFDKMTQNIFNYFIPEQENLQNKDEQIRLKPKFSSSTEIMESTNEIKISNLTIFPLIVYYCSFCSPEIKNKLIDTFISNTKTTYLSSLLDLNSWYFWITNFLLQYKPTKDDDFSFFINPFIDFFTNEIIFQSSTEKVVELFLFLKDYSSKFNFDFRQIQLTILIDLLTSFKDSSSKDEIALLYPIVYSCLQIEIKNDQFELTNENYKIENKEEAIFDIFTDRYKNNFNFSFKSENATNQNLRLLLIQSVLNLKENVSVNLYGCDKSEIYLLTSFILVDYVNENKDENNEELVNNYKNTILGLQKKYSKKYKKILEILANITNKDLILSLEKQILSKYFIEMKSNLKNKLTEIHSNLLKDLQESDATKVKIEGKNSIEICQLLLRNDKEINEFLKTKFDCYDSCRDEKMGREKLRIQRIQNSFLNGQSKNTIDQKYKILNQISISGSRNLMSINNNFTNHIDNKIKWLGKIEIKNSYKYQLSPYSKERIKVSLDAKLLTLTEVIDGILFIVENKVIFFSSLKVVEIQIQSISFIFNRVFSDIEKEYQGCEIFTNENRSYYFVFNDKRDLFYQNLPDYNQYMQLVAEKYQMTELKKIIDLNFDETLKFDFLGSCRKICQSIYQTQNSSNLLLQLNLPTKWQNYIISNFEYIYYLNMLSNRSYHTGSRYPYYPSLLRQFDSEKININDESNYRNLCMPTIFHFKDRLIGLPLSSFPISDHSISYLMARVEPFTTLMFCINDQKFDARILSSAKKMWDKEPMVSSPELIPEVYGLPFYLVNENKFELGTKIDGEKIDDVTLPVWSKNHFVFTAVQRLMLENDCASKNMAKWIDMTFGANQNKYDGQTLFLESKACLVGCFPDQIIKGRGHPDRFNKTSDENGATNTSSGSNNNNNAGFCLSSLNESVRSPFLNLAKEKGALNSAGFGDFKVKILGIVKEFIHFKKGGSSFVVDVNQTPFVTMQVPEGSGDLIGVSRPLKLALFGVKNEDFLTVVNLQKKSVSLQCKTVARILCVKTIGGRFALTGGSDCIVRVWDMAHNFCLVSASCFHEDEIVAVSGCRNTGIIASIDRSMNLVIETLYNRKLIAFVSIGKTYENTLIQVTQSSLIILAKKGQIQCLDSRGRSIHTFEVNGKDDNNGNGALVTSMNIYYEYDSREILAAALNSGEILLIDLSNFSIVGRNKATDSKNGFLTFCTMKKSRAVLVSDAELTKAFLFGKLISPEISNDSNQQIGEMESFSFNEENK